jgi:glycerophosphoryl diester phosphodiesterase
MHLVAHRGNAHEFPENTLPAFESALALGLRCLELDVQLSADGVPVVIHDHRLERTAAIPGTVFELRASELARLDACEPERFGERFRGTHIPLLREVLGLLDGRPDITLFVEIKRASLGQFGVDRVVTRVLETLKPARAQCVVISFDLAAVYRARQISGGPIGWVLSDYDTHSRLKYETLQPEYLFCDHEKLPASGALWRGPWHWAVYEISTMSLALALAKRGVEYIETMCVSQMSQAMRGMPGAEFPPGAAPPPSP